jgi:hypothetical protein
MPSLALPKPLIALNVGRQLDQSVIHNRIVSAILTWNIAIDLIGADRGKFPSPPG